MVLLRLFDYQGALTVRYHRLRSFYRRRLFAAYDLVLSVSIKGIKYLIKSSVTIYSIISTNNVKTNTVISWKRQKGGFYEPE